MQMQGLEQMQSTRLSLQIHELPAHFEFLDVVLHAPVPRQLLMLFKSKHLLDKQSSNLQIPVRVDDKLAHMGPPRSKYLCSYQSEQSSTV